MRCARPGFRRFDFGRFVFGHCAVARGGVGLIDPAFAKCVRDGKYRSWAANNTDQAAKHGVTALSEMLHMELADAGAGNTDGTPAASKLESRRVKFSVA